METKVIAYAPLACNEQCREEKRAFPLFVAVLAFILASVISILGIPEKFWLDLVIWQPDRNAIAGAISVAISVAVFSITWALSKKFLTKDCRICMESIRRSHLPKKKIWWFGYF